MAWCLSFPIVFVDRPLIFLHLCQGTSTEYDLHFTFLQLVVCTFIPVLYGLNAPLHDKLELACVWTSQQHLTNMLGNCWCIAELVSILANFFANFSELANSLLNFAATSVYTTLFYRVLALPPTRAKYNEVSRSLSRKNTKLPTFCSLPTWVCLLWRRVKMPLREPWNPIQL